MRIGWRPTAYSIYGNASADTPSANTANANTASANTASANTASADTACTDTAAGEQLPAGFLGRPRYDTSCAKRHDVQVH
jgi:hypothetical protein